MRIIKFRARGGKLAPRTFWISEKREDVDWELSTWYRCFGIEKFMEKVEKENIIAAIVFEDNNIGFLLRPSPKIQKNQTGNGPATDFFE